MRMRRIQLREKGRGGGAGKIRGYYTLTVIVLKPLFPITSIRYIFLPQLITFISDFSYSEFQGVQGEVFKKPGCQDHPYLRETSILSFIKCFITVCGGGQYRYWQGRGKHNGLPTYCELVHVKMRRFFETKCGLRILILV
jgi:hypothetical protein